MAHLKAYIPKGFGEANFNSHAYVPAIRVGDAIHLSGQGGWNQDTFKFDNIDIEEEIDQAFANVDFVLKSSGAKGWSQVYKVRSYHMPLDGRAQDAMVRNFRKWMPDHKALWTCIQTGRLGDDKMRVEIEVEAHDPEGAAKARAEEKA